MGILQQLLQPLTSIPWYTWVMLALVSLFLLGCFFTMATLVTRGLWYVFVSSWLGLCMGVAKLLQASPSSYGTARWAHKRDLTKAGVWHETGLALGTWKNGRIIREPRGGHVCIIAPPRSRKSWGLIMPAIKHHSGSIVVNDLRGELHQHTSQDREQRGPVWKFNPSAPDSCSLNLLDGVRWGSRWAYGAVDRIAHHVLGPTGHALEDSFRANAIPLMRSIIFDRFAVGAGHFPGVSAWLNDPTRTQKEKLEALLDESDDPLVHHGARRTLDMSERLRQGIWHAATESVGIFADPIIASHTAKSDVLLEDLLHGIDPVTLYLTMGFHEVERLGRYYGLFVETIVTLVSAPHAPARHVLLLCLDEMANLGELPTLEKAVSYLQGSGAQLLAVFQNINQVIDTYGPTTPLLSSMASQVYYTPVSTDLRTAELVSRALGQTTVLGSTTGPTIAHDQYTMAHMYSEHARPLMTPDEVTRIPPTDAIIFLQEQPPIYATKLGQTPAHWSIRWTAMLAQHPAWAATVGVACVLMLTLWPLTRLHWSHAEIAQLTATLRGTPQQPLPQPVPKGKPTWLVMREGVDMRGKQRTEVKSPAWSEEECREVLHIHVKMLENPLPERKGTTHHLDDGRVRRTWATPNGLYPMVAETWWCDLAR